jgi:hypothetical protein
MLHAAGVEGASLVRARTDPATFGDGEVVIQLGCLLLRVIRDRGQEFLDVASSLHPERFFPYDDMEIAMGWTTVTAVLERQELEGLANTVFRAASRLRELQAAFSEAQEHGTLERLERASQERRTASAKRMRHENGLRLGDTGVGG